MGLEPKGDPMLALSLSPARGGRDSHRNNDLPTDDTQPRLTWRRWVEMLKPDTPSQYRTSYDGWRTNVGCELSSMPEPREECHVADADADEEAVSDGS